MQIFLNQLQAPFSDEIIVLVCDGTALHIPPYTPEMNPIEQIRHELRTKSFRNEVFSTLEQVVDRLCKTINHLLNDTVMRVTQHDWIRSIFI